MGMILQSSRFKAVSLLVGLLLFASLVVTFTSLREAEVLELLRMKPEERLKFDKTVDDLVSFQDAMMTERRGATVAEIRALVGLSLPLSLIAEIRNLAQNDEDIAHLSSMASELKL